LKERRPSCSTTASPLPTHWFHWLKTCIELPTSRHKLSLEHVTSPPRKKSITTFGSPIVDLKEDKEGTYLDEIRVRGGEELYAIVTQGSIEEKPKPNLDQVIDNIQVEHVVFTKLVVPIVEPTQHVVVTT